MFLQDGFREKELKQMHMGEMEKMNSFASAATFDELSSYIIKRHTLMVPLVFEWTEIARKAVQRTDYNRYRFADVETRLNALRPELRRAVLVASEHFTDDELNELRRRANITMKGWRALKDSSLITLRNGFSLAVF